MPKRLAITISGAVSLGSYEAGVLFEIISALGQHNTDATTPPDERITIDVITGASAGGMTATIAAQKLMYEASALNGTYTNAFYSPWVADISLDGLLAMHGNDDAAKSILSSDTVIDISRRYLTQRYQSHMDPERIKHTAAADRLWLGLAMSNLNGVDYGFSVQPNGRFVYTRHADELTTWFDSNSATDDTLDFWEPLRNAAVSCGAFPFAFRPIDVLRQANEYTDSNLASTLAPTQSFAYTDGGVFQNEPLGLAKKLVNRVDHHLDVANRFYLFIAPHARSSSAVSDFSADKSNHRTLALRLIGSVFSQSQFHDWVQAEAMNDKVATYNAQATALLTAFLSGNLTPAQSQPVVAVVLAMLFSQAAPPVLDAARARVAQQFAPEVQQLTQNRDGATAATYVDMLLAFESIAGLADRDEMTIYGITAESAELASWEISAFAGFFDRRYRDHDYEVGRRKAQTFLQNPGLLGPIRFTPTPIGTIDPSLDGLTLDRMDRSIREAVRDRMRDRSKEIMKQFGIDPWLVGGTVRDAIDRLVVKPQLEKLLKLS